MTRVNTFLSDVDCSSAEAEDLEVAGKTALWISLWLDKQLVMESAFVCSSSPMNQGKIHCLSVTRNGAISLFGDLLGDGLGQSGPKEERCSFVFFVRTFI